MPGKIKKRYTGIDYKILLKVGEMKMNGLKHREIAKKIDPQKYRDEPDNATRNMSHYYRKFEKLVNNGYRDMIF